MQKCDFFKLKSMTRSFPKLSVSGPSECLFSFFTNRESTSERPKLYLGPGNATVSSDLSVTLGCKANVAVKTCSWTFYPDSNPGMSKLLIKSTLIEGSLIRVLRWDNLIAMQTASMPLARGYR